LYDFADDISRVTHGDGLDKFIALIIAFSRLSFEDNGIIGTFVKNNVGLVKDPEIPTNDKVVQKGNQLEFEADGSGNKFTVDLGDVISRDPATVGRSTVVMEATSEKWPGMELVVKISWPSSGRVRETEFLTRRAKRQKSQLENGPRNTFLKCFTSRTSNSAKIRLSSLSRVCSKMKMPQLSTENTYTNDVRSGSLSRSDCTLWSH
jgi:hypothetical protein